MEADDREEIEEGTGSTLRLKTWQQRKWATMGYDPALDHVTQHLPLFPTCPLRSRPAASCR